MNDMLILNNVSAYNSLRGKETFHPHITVVDFEQHPLDIPKGALKMRMDFYFIALKDVVCGDIRYGRGNYDYQEGTLVFVGPGQVVELSRAEDAPSPRGMALAFHADLIRRTNLGSRMADYRFFSYEVNEALHLSEGERKIVSDCLLNISSEISQNIDRHTKTLIASHIELLLNYCTRFYDRQFITRSGAHHDVVTRFEQALRDHFQTEESMRSGIPTVQYFASKLHLSANYFGDLIKKETGRSPQQHIQDMLIEQAKERILMPGKSMGSVAFDLGFSQTQHFSRFFKQHTGISPSEYRTLLN